MSKIIVLQSGSRAQLNPLHSGFAHGFGIFETIRLTDGRLEFWKAHYARLLRSAKKFNLSFDPDESAVLSAIRELVEAEKLCNGIVKLSLLKGLIFSAKTVAQVRPRTAQTSARSSSHDAVAHRGRCCSTKTGKDSPQKKLHPLLHEGDNACCYVYTRPFELPDEAVQLRLDIQSALNERSALAGHKTHNYMEAMYLKQSAERAGFFDVVRLNTAGFLAETAVANLFFVKDGNLRTPAVSTGILPGVIRAEVMKIAEKHSISIEEGHYPMEDLKAADAVFLTNSSIGILPVSSINTKDSDLAFDVSHPMIHVLKVALATAKKRKSLALIHE